MNGKFWKDVEKILETIEGMKPILFIHVYDCSNQIRTGFYGNL